MAESQDEKSEEKSNKGSGTKGDSASTDKLFTKFLTEVQFVEVF